jgi:hypothetical protein
MDQTRRSLWKAAPPGGDPVVLGFGSAHEPVSPAISRRKWIEGRAESGLRRASRHLNTYDPAVADSKLSAHQLIRDVHRRERAGFALVRIGTSLARNS